MMNLNCVLRLVDIVGRMGIKQHLGMDESWGDRLERNDLYGLVRFDLNKTNICYQYYYHLIHLRNYYDIMYLGRKIIVDYMRFYIN